MDFTLNIISSILVIIFNVVTIIIATGTLIFSMMNCNK